MIKKIMAFVGLAMIGTAIFLARTRSPSYEWLRDRVVNIVKGRSSCSGEQIKAPSGVNYILTAAHCRDLMTDGMFTVVKEDGTSLQRRFIAEDADSDLMLLEGLPALEGIEIADKLVRFQYVRTFTHRHGLATYKTTGSIIDETEITVPVALVASPEDAEICESFPKYAVVYLFSNMGFCVLKVMETATTAQIVPGSSGGAIVDDAGRLIGVASATDGFFGYLVRLSDIKRFLAGY